MSFQSFLKMLWSQKSSVRVAVVLGLFHSRLCAGLWVWRWPVVEKYLHPNTTIIRRWQGQIEPCSDGLSGCSSSSVFSLYYRVEIISLLYFIGKELQITLKKQLEGFSNILENTGWCLIAIYRNKIPCSEFTTVFHTYPHSMAIKNKWQHCLDLICFNFYFYSPRLICPGAEKSHLKDKRLEPYFLITKHCCIEVS